MSSFDQRIVAVSGSLESIAAMARACGAEYRTVATRTGYTFDHGSAVFLLDRDGETSAILDSGEPQHQRLAKLKGLLRQLEAVNDLRSPPRRINGEGVQLMSRARPPTESLLLGQQSD